MSEHTLTDEDAAAYLATGVTPVDLVRLRWPDADEALVSFVLWERTPFPLVRGVHDVVDAVADIDETICGETTLRGVCRRTVHRFGDLCWQHRGPITVRLAKPTVTPADSTRAVGHE